MMYLCKRGLLTVGSIAITENQYHGNTTSDHDGADDNGYANQVFVPEDFFLVVTGNSDICIVDRLAFAGRS